MSTETTIYNLEEYVEHIENVIKLENNRFNEAEPVLEESLKILKNCQLPESRTFNKNPLLLDRLLNSSLTYLENGENNKIKKNLVDAIADQFNNASSFPKDYQGLTSGDSSFDIFSKNLLKMLKENKITADMAMPIYKSPERGYNPLSHKFVDVMLDINHPEAVDFANNSKWVAKDKNKEEVDSVRLRVISSAKTSREISNLHKVVNDCENPEVQAKFLEVFAKNLPNKHVGFENAELANEIISKDKTGKMIEILEKDSFIKIADAVYDSHSMDSNKFGGTVNLMNKLLDKYEYNLTPKEERQIHSTPMLGEVSVKLTNKQNKEDRSEIDAKKKILDHVKSWESMKKEQSGDNKIENMLINYTTVLMIKGIIEDKIKPEGNILLYLNNGLEKSKEVFENKVKKDFVLRNVEFKDEIDLSKIMSNTNAVFQEKSTVSSKKEDNEVATEKKKNFISNIFKKKENNDTVLPKETDSVDQKRIDSDMHKAQETSYASMSSDIKNMTSSMLNNKNIRNENLYSHISETLNKISGSLKESYAKKNSLTRAINYKKDREH